MHDKARGRRALVIGLADVVALVALRPAWPDLARDLGAPHQWVAQNGADQAAATLIGAALWCAAVWLGLGLIAAFLAHRPGRLGLLGARLAARMLPRALNRALAGAVGLSVILTPVAAGATSTGTSASTAVGTVTSTAPSTAATPGDFSSPPVWPTDLPDRLTPAKPPTPTPTATTPTATTPSATTPTMTTPTATVAPDAPPATVTPATEPRSVTVAAGDSLWLIAARRLGPQASPQQISASWPQWYAANRALVGPDPALIQPGTVLQAPS